jgi:hypothetical protein
MQLAGGIGLAIMMLATIVGPTGRPYPLPKAK